MKFRNLSIVVISATVFSVLGAMKAASADLGSGGAPVCSNASELIANLHREWLLGGWEKRVGDAPFDFQAKFAKYYDFESKDVILYDDFAPQRQVARSASAYGDLWKKPFTELRSARHGVIDDPQVIVGRDLATSTLEFAAALEAMDRTVIGIRTRSTLVWRCGANGWRIVREHNSSTVVSAADAEVLLRSASATGAVASSASTYVGMWVTRDGQVRHELLPTGRYDEARDSRESAYRGRFEADGNRISYWDDTGFTAKGIFVSEDELHHGGMVFYRRR